MSNRDETYDLFVSYSHADEGWVKDELLPRLHSWDISVCIDRTHFIDGEPVDEELNRLVRISRQSLLVISANWATSNFTDYELQLMLDSARSEDYEQFLPVLIEKCDLPPVLRQFQIIDSQQLGWHNTWLVLQRSLARTKTLPARKRLAVELKVSKIPAPEEEYGYSYFCHPLVANIDSDVCRFDSTNIEFEVNDYDNEFHGGLRALRIMRLAEGVVVQASYHGTDYFAGIRRLTSSDRELPVVLSLDPLQSRALGGVKFSYSPVSVPGKKVVRMFVHLRLNDRPVTERCICVLPPVLRLPEFQRHEGLGLTMASEQFVPTASQFLEKPLRKSIFHTAAAHSPDSLLINLAPRAITRHDLTSKNGTDSFYSCNDWEFSFYSRERGVFGIRAADPKVIQPYGQRQESAPTSWLHERMLSECQIDCDIAYLMALAIDATPLSSGAILGLEGFKLPDGLWRPIWKLPFRFQNLPLGVLADTCEVVTLSDGGWLKPPGLLWNTY